MAGFFLPRGRLSPIRRRSSALAIAALVESLAWGIWQASVCLRGLTTTHSRDCGHSSLIWS